MWAIDRANLILLGVALGIIAVVGLVLLLAPTSSSESTPSHPPLAESSPVGDSVLLALEQEVTENASAPQPDTEDDPSLPDLMDTAAPSTSQEPAIDGIIHTGEYRHATAAGGFHVYWSNDATVLRVGLFSPGSGYVSIGFDPDYRMQGANFIIGAIRNGQTILRDDYGVGPLAHASDVDQGGRDDILAAAGRELDGQTTIEFVIPLDSEDPFDKALEPGQTYDILVAFHNTSDSFSARHSQRGSGTIRLDDAP